MTDHKGRIVIVGVLDVPGSTNVYMAKAFMQAGYDVVPCNYRTILHHYGPKTLERTLHRLSLDKPKLMLFSKCNGIKSSIIGRCSLNTKTWLWFMDGLNTLNTVPEIIDHMSLADYSSCTGLGVARLINKKTGITVHHIMEGIDPEIYRPSIRSEQFISDVSFIGTANQERNKYLQALVDNGYGVKAYGAGYSEEVHGGMFNMVCSSSASMLAISAEHGTNEYFSDRIFRYGACGSFVVHRYTPSMEKYFKDGEDLVYFHDVDSLLEVLDKYLRTEDASVRGTVANNLYNKVLGKHTWLQTVQKIIEIAEI